MLDSRDLPLLVDGDGFFHRGFIGLFRLVHSRRANEALEQIERECTAQTERLESLGFELDHVDSHQHVHMIPQIFRIAAALAAARGIAIRVADEPLFLPDREPVRTHSRRVQPCRKRVPNLPAGREKSISSGGLPAADC